jgi:hypothetical protein
VPAKGAPTALINRRFARAIPSLVLADDPEGGHNSLRIVIAARVLVRDGYPMTLVLLAVGLLATAAGFVTIGFGIPINAFSLGNTLIIAGTIGVAAGLILIGIAIVVGQLKRIAEALRARGGRLAESVETMVPPTARMTPAAAPEPALSSVRAAPMPQPMAPEPPMDLYVSSRTPEPQPEPRFLATASELPAPAPSAPAPGPLDWLRAKPKSTNPAPAAVMPPPPMPAMPRMSEPPMVEPPMVPDEAPLSPRPPLRPAMPPMVEPAMEPKAWSPDRGNTPDEARSAPRVEQPMPRATPQPEPPKEKFDLVWPDRASAPGASAPAPAAEPARQAALEMPLPPIPARPRDNRSAEKRADSSLPKSSAERGPAILKSGVIDGMPYTLYADGSIEAELPKGTVKFASVDALRAHLEKNG